MIRLKSILLELGEATAAPFDWKFHSGPSIAEVDDDLHDDLTDVVYIFDTPDWKYNVTFIPLKKTEYMLEFAPIYNISTKERISKNVGYDLITGAGVFSIMATLTDILKDFRLRYPIIHRITWLSTPDKWNEKEKQYDTTRDALYLRYIQTQLPGAKVTSSKDGYVVDYGDVTYDATGIDTPGDPLS